MKILYYKGTESGVGAHSFIDMAWCNAIKILGHQLITISNSNIYEWEKKILNGIDFALIANFPNIPRIAPILTEARRKGVFVAHTIDKHNANLILKQRQISEFADVFFGEIEFDALGEIINATSGNYLLVPCAADSLFHFIDDTYKSKYNTDVIFIGNKRTQKSESFKRYLEPLSKNQNITTKIFGPFWRNSDYAIASIGKIVNKFGFSEIGKELMFRYLGVPLNEERLAYRNSKVSLNFHEREEGWIQRHHIVNGRTFKIAASGGVLLSDYVVAMENYFEPDKEYFSFSSEDEFIEKINKLLIDKKIASNMRNLAAKRAHSEHYQKHRLIELLSTINGIEGKYVKKYKIN